MRGFKIGLVVLALLLAGLVAYGYGCGDGGDDGSGTAAGSSREGGAGGSGDATGAADATDGADASEGAGRADGSDTSKSSRPDVGDGADADGGAAGGEAGADGATAAAPLTKKQFVKQGDAVCAKVPQRYGERLRALEKKNKGKQPSIAEANLAAAVPPLPEAARELEALRPPKGDEQQAAAIVAALEAAAQGLEAKPSSELSGPKSPFWKFQQLTRKYGFQVCSQL